ncbi:MAG TPA: tetratricopeptide repeat protein [Acidobacteriota bacterium]
MKNRKAKAKRILVRPASSRKRTSLSNRESGDLARSQASYSYRRNVIFLVASTLGLLAPFINKPFHIDDPLFIWTARHILVHPIDFYGFEVNWYGNTMCMADVMKNPPIASYYMALVGLLLGWKEVALHIAFLLPAVALIVGIYYLAVDWCSRPLLAALSALVTPVFLLCGTSLMCDVMMTAFWVWAVVLWRRGLDRDNGWNLFFGAFLAGIGSLTKYFGMALLPLILPYSWSRERRWGRWLIFLLVPLAMLLAYQWTTQKLFGRGLLADAASYTEYVRTIYHAQALTKGLTGLAFTGGCLAVAFFYSTLLWSRRSLIVAVCVMAAIVFALFALGKTGESPLQDASGIEWISFMQVVLWVTTGLSVLALAAVDLWHGRNNISLLLFLWITGTFAFASFINWTASGRNILPMLPAVGILLARQIDRRYDSLQPKNRWQTTWPLIPAAALALMITWADYSWAETARAAAFAFGRTGTNLRGKLWFQGHWGFQYYMELLGASPFDTDRTALSIGDTMIVPENNTNLYALQQDGARLVQEFQFKSFPWLATMNRSLGASFYSDIWGLLPFGVGPVPLEKYFQYQVRNPSLALVPQKSTADSIAYYITVLRENPSDAVAHLKLGVALAQQGRTSEALNQYSQALRIKPDYAEAHINMGIELAADGKINEAVGHFSKAAEIKPNSPEAHYNLGKAYVLLGNRNAALEQYTILKNLDPKLADDLVKAIGQ